MPPQPRVLALLTTALFAASGADPSIGICDLMRHPERYDKKVVVVTGSYFHSRHGATIANENCGFQNRYAPFGMGAAADLGDFDIDMVLPKGMSVDQGSIHRFHEAVANAMIAAKPAEPEIDFTIRGLVRVIRHYKLDETGNSGTGFGFTGRYPVQILIPSVERFRVYGAK